MTKRTAMIRAMAAVFSLSMLFQADAALAETCNAGHGCSITCPDGCSAVYNHDTGECSTACGQPVSAAQLKSSHGHVSAVFQDTPRVDVDKLLKALDKKSPTKK